MEPPSLTSFQEVLLYRTGKYPSIERITSSRSGSFSKMSWGSCLTAPITRVLMAACWQLGSTPEGVFAREVQGRTLYVNTTTAEKQVSIAGKKQGLLSGEKYNETLRLPPYGVDLLE